jgi:hypothetical protein
MFTYFSSLASIVSLIALGGMIADKLILGIIIYSVINVDELPN